MRTEVVRFPFCCVRMYIVHDWTRRDALHSRGLTLHRVPPPEARQHKHICNHREQQYSLMSRLLGVGPLTRTSSTVTI